MFKINCHSSWEEFLTVKRIEQLKEIAKEVEKSNYTPASELVLRFLKLDKNKIKVVILGQDPYFSENNGKRVANGRAFEPSDLNDWSSKFRQVSLKNIVRLIHKNYKAINDYQNIYKYSQILKEIQKGEFKLKQPHQLFDSWEKQGVLLLNTAFTTELNCPNKHQKLWQAFSQELIDYIDSEEIVWLLWGKNALSYSNNLKGRIIKSRHPMMCSSKFEDDFLKSDCFLKTSDLINWLG